MIRWGPVVVLAISAAAQPQPPAGALMARVASNQERALAARSQYVYQQTLLVRMRRADHKLAREERSEFAITPVPAGIDKKLVKFSGRYEQKGGYHEYDRPHFQYKDVDLDGEIISDLADDMTADRGSRDGIARDLFPLTAAEQRKYEFRIAGAETFRGREVYRVKFSPKPGAEDATWSGEALVDVKECEPVRITTGMARGIPFWVKTLLGTNVKQLGFSVAYEPFENGVWFPVSYGGEFEVKALFLYKRLITVSLANAGFRKADITTTVSYQPEP